MCQDFNPYIIVDKNTQTFQLNDETGVVISQRAIIGKPYRPTPETEDVVTHVVINPWWNVPAKLARLDIVPLIQADPSIIDRLGYEFYEDYDRKVKIDPETIDWNSFTRKTPIPFRIVQRPGPHNALGSVKFILANTPGIRVHGTSKQYLFDREDRKFSSGCVRIERPVELARYLLPDVDIERMIGRDEKWFKLSQPVRISIIESGSPIYATMR